MERKWPQLVKFPDAAGDTITFWKHENGTLLCPAFDEAFDYGALRTMTMRDDDIIICSYPRSGCHWLWEQLRMLLAGTTDVPVEEKQSGMMEANSLAKLDPLPSPRIFNTHVLFQQLPEDVQRKQTKLVIIYRDPKDVAVSLYTMYRNSFMWQYEGKFSNWLPLFYQGKVDGGNLATYLNDWAKMMEDYPDHPIHVLKYEDLKKNPVHELSRLSLFLSLDHNTDFLQSVSDACAIDRMRERKATIWEKRGCSTNLMYRNGKSGVWREHFTEAMNEQFDQNWSQNFKAQKVFRF